MKRILVFLILAGICFGANEIHYFDTTGQTDLYCRITQQSTLSIWDTGISDVNDNPAWADTDIALTESDPNFSPGLYYATFPSTLASGRYYIESYSGASPAKTDTRLQTWQMDWSGLAEITLASTLTANVTQWDSNDVAASTVSGVPEVDVTHINGDEAAAGAMEDYFTPNYYLAFMWTGDLVSISNNAALDFGTDDFSISFWYKADSLVNEDVVITDKSSGAGFLIKFDATDNTLSATISDGVNTATLSKTDALFVNDWTNYTFIFDRNRAADLYINGVFAATCDITDVTGSLDNTNNASISAGAGYNLKGGLDQVGVYKKALSVEEITILYNGGLGIRLTGSEDGLSWGSNCDDGTGSTLTDITGTVNGTITGATWKLNANRVETLNISTSVLANIKSEVEAADLSSSTIGTIGATGLAAINAEVDTAITDAALATAAGLAATDANVTLILADSNEMQADGVVLKSTGLDAVATTEPNGVATDFREMIVQLYQRFFNKATSSTTELKVYKDDGTTVNTTQSVSKTGTTQTIGAAE